MKIVRLYACRACSLLQVKTKPYKFIIKTRHKQKINSQIKNERKSTRIIIFFLRCVSTFFSYKIYCVVEHKTNQYKMAESKCLHFLWLMV